MKKMLWLLGLLGVVACATRLGGNMRARTIVARVGEVHPTFAARAVVVPAHGTVSVLASSGRAERVAVNVGDRVHAGDLLAVVRSGATDERLAAPVDGTIIARRVEPGDTVGASPLPLFEVADTSQLELRIEIDERDASDVQLGAPVRWVDATAHVDRLSPEISRREDALDDVATRATTRVRLAWAALPEGTAALVGAHGIAHIDAPARSAAIVVPREAIVLRDGRAALRVRRGPWVDEVRVKLGAYDANDVSVDGVTAGAVVVLP